MMTRRQMFKATVVAYAGVVPTLSKTDGKYGFLSPDECRRRGLYPHQCVVFLDGRNVTHRTLALNDREGWIEVPRRLSDGGVAVNVDGTLARHREYGHVEVRFAASGQAPDNPA